MANVLDVLVPKIIANGLKGLRENSIMPLLVNRDYDREAAMRGQSITIPIPSAMGEAEDVVPSTVAGTPTDIAPTSATIVLDTWIQKSFVLTDREINQIIQDGHTGQVYEAARSLANRIDRDLLNQAKKFFGYAGTAGETPFQREPATPLVHHGIGASQEARRVLNRQLCPMADRRIVLDVDAEANATALPQFTAADAAGTDITIREAVIGKKLGFSWYLDQNVPTHETTLATGTAITLNGAQSAGVTSITVAGVTAAASEGDIIEIAGETQPYVVGAGATATVMPISPPLRNDVADGAAVTVVGSHVLNLAFHKDALAIAIRPMLDIDPVSNIMRTITDDVTGLPLRLEISRENKQTRFSFDILYGVTAPRPEYGCRILG